MGILELVGVMLLSFALGVWIKDWGLERASIIYAYIKESVTNREWWNAQYQKNLADAERQIAALASTIRAMDDARNALHKAISQDLVPKIKSQEILVNTLSVSLEERTVEKSLAAAQLRDTMLKLEHFIGENRIANAKIMDLEGTVTFMKAERQALCKELTNALCTFPSVKKGRPRHFSELVNLKGKRGTTRKFDILGNLIDRYNGVKRKS